MKAADDVGDKFVKKDDRTVMLNKEANFASSDDW